MLGEGRVKHRRGGCKGAADFGAEIFCASCSIFYASCLFFYFLGLKFLPCEPARGRVLVCGLVAEGGVHEDDEGGRESRAAVEDGGYFAHAFRGGTIVADAG